ncbi:hypothetical protein N1851_026291 [Merluccius polli]|uniref:Uncharacterized protein n=1 Tax=Merluccius polli TaxID=89951 RepID=A0AA47NT48_MERPO|nr:hypothetical protein N1851_026291 [Merluccius polli]
MKGRHTYDAVGFEMELIHSAFGLSRRITATVTDNRSNFVKAFKMYALQPDKEEHAANMCVQECNGEVRCSLDKGKPFYLGL